MADPELVDTTTTTTTIEGVSILTKQRRSRGDVFDIELSPEGVEIRRAGRPPAHMSWARVSQWDIKKRRGGALLTLRGGGATTPLVVPGWTPDDLEVVMRATAGAPTPAGDGAATVTPAPAPEPVADAFTQPSLAPVADTTAETAEPAAPTAPTATGAPGTRRRLFSRTSAATWKSVVTVVLLALLAAAVTLVLLQSAGIISWGFLGPTA